ncbi:type I restriction enzyme StySJI M protein [Escherichia coli]|uniref:Type I restriction enzyme StySJI M protein n=1 Tax=Escherichia coli TaxID=562 RepID=A0A376MQA8_ECOLX|nr:type I restriction enzyme StySJI M protein [Escherichia coli]
MNNNDLVAKLWKLCDNLRDGGVSYQNYVNETRLAAVFENGVKRTGQEAEYLPEGYRWDDLKSRIGQEQLQFYRNLLVHWAPTIKAGAGGVPERQHHHYPAKNS